MTRKRVTTPNGRRTYDYRLQVETALGRRLKSDDHVHHIDGNPTNNEWENLAVMPRGIHVLLTRLEQNLDKITLFNHEGRPYHPEAIVFFPLPLPPVIREEDIGGGYL